MQNNIRGVMVPIVTPLTPNGNIDIKSLRNLVNYIIDNGVHGIWAAGTTGEFAALSNKQRITLIETVVDEVAGRVPVIGNVAAASTQLAVDLGLSVREIALTGIAATPPYYFNCAQDELLDHYRHIFDKVGAPLWVYNIPSTVKTVVEPATIAQLAMEGTVVGIKDSSGDGEALAHLNMLCIKSRINMYRFLGTISRTTSARAVGAHGVIMGLSNVAPAVVSRAWEAGESDDTEGVKNGINEMTIANNLMNLPAAGGSYNAKCISALKSALKAIGIIEHATVTRPFRPLSEEESQPIPEILKSLGLIT